MLKRGRATCHLRFGTAGEAYIAATFALMQTAHTHPSTVGTSGGGLCNSRRGPPPAAGSSGTTTSRRRPTWATLAPRPCCRWAGERQRCVLVNAAEVQHYSALFGWITAASASSAPPGFAAERRLAPGPAHGAATPTSGITDRRHAPRGRRSFPLARPRPRPQRDPSPRRRDRDRGGRGKRPWRRQPRPEECLAASRNVPSRPATVFLPRCRWNRRSS